MRTKKNIQMLLESGLSSAFVAKLNDSQMKSLVERFKKEETKEVIQTTQQSGYKTTITPGTQANLNVNGTDISVDPSKGITMMSTDKPVGTGEVTEVDVNEKFESKAQQRLFYSRCGNGKTKTEKKWCKWAKEFSKETNYETTPEKKEKNESDEKFIEESIVRLIEKNVNPKMSKGDLIRTINEKSQESSMILKNPLKNTMFSKESGIEMKRMKKPTMGMPVMGTMEENTKEKEAPVKEPGIKTPPKRRDNPFKNPNPGTKEKPRGEKKTKDEMKTDFIGLIKQALNKK